MDASGVEVTDRFKLAGVPVTKENVSRVSGELGFANARKTAYTMVSTFLVEPGTTFETPEGLKAEDEPCRIAFDSQGGVYPIRESVFRETYEVIPGTAAPLV